MDFTLSPEIADLQMRTRRFIAEKVIPYERDPRCTPHGPTEDLRNELVGLARAEGLLTPHGPREFGGLGLSHVAKALVFEESGYSTLGPTAMNVHAPDEGNIHLMEAVGSEAQKERWITPLCGPKPKFGALATTEPGAGSDASAITTHATNRPRRDTWGS